MIVEKNVNMYFLIFFILTAIIISTVSGVLKENVTTKLADQNKTNNNEMINNSNYIIDVNEDDIHLLARAVYSEARGESLEGQVAVASVIINRVKNSGFPSTIKEVIFQPWAFTAVHDGQFWLEPDPDAYKAAKYALKGWDPSGKALFYYNPARVTANWIYSRPVIGRIGKHVFAQ